MSGKKKGRTSMWLTVTMVIYIAMLVYVCFFSEGYGRTDISTEYNYNLVPFKEIMRFYTYREEIGFIGFVTNLFGNVLAFVPFGFLIAGISRNNRHLINVFVMTLMLSFTIEVIQLVFRVGSFDVDDLILNTLGGVLGYGIFKSVHWIRRKVSGKSSIWFYKS